MHGGIALLVLVAALMPLAGFAQQAHAQTTDDFLDRLMELQRDWLAYLGVEVADAPPSGDAARVAFDTANIESRVTALVRETVDQYRSNGEAAFDMITPESATYSDALYPFVLDAVTLESVANGAFLDFFGVIPDSLARADRPLDGILADLHRDGDAWIEYMATNPDTGTVQLKRSWLYLHDGYIFGAGHYLYDSGVQQVVESAVLLYESEGTNAFGIITPKAEISTPDHYPFVLNATDLKTEAHATIPSLVGVCCSDAIQNTGDRPIESILADLRRDGGTWVEYIFTNPDTHTEQLKRTWLYLHDGYIFGSGYYYPDSRIQSQVDDAVHLYKSNGEDAFGIITPEVADGFATIYPFVLDGTTLEIVAHGAFPDELGSTHDGLMEADVSLDRILADLHEGSVTWVAYISENPGTGTDQLTRAYLSLHDGYVFGSGYYFPDSRVQSMVDEAVYTYRSDGQAAFDSINAGDLNRQDVYPIVRNTTHVQAHGTIPNLVGPFPSPQASKSTEQLMSSIQQRGGVAWNNILFINPHSGTEQVKRIWLDIHDGYLFASSYAVPDADVRSAVDYAIFVYESNKEDDAWVDIITPDEPIITADIYPFVLNATDWATVAHGTLPQQVGQCCSYAIQETSTRPFADVVGDLAEHEQAWVTYAFLNPDTGADQYKRTYLEVRDGYIFGAGYYLLDSQVQGTVWAGTLNYDRGGEAAFASINTPPEEAISVYLFVVDPDSGMVEAQNVDPNLIGGASDWEIITASELVGDLLAELSTESGAWVAYEFINPVTGELEGKRAWLTMHDGLIFGSGYYSSDAVSVG